MIITCDVQGIELDRLKVEVSSLKERLTSKEEELVRAEENIEALKRKLEETTEMLRTNENGKGSWTLLSTSINHRDGMIYLMQ